MTRGTFKKTKSKRQGTTKAIQALIMSITVATTGVLPIVETAQANPIPLAKLLVKLAADAQEFAQNYAAKHFTAAKFESVLIRNVVRNSDGYRLEDISDLLRGSQPVDLVSDPLIHQDTTPQLPQSVDLRWADNLVQDQGEDGTCTAYAIAATIENELYRRNFNRVKASERHIWSFYQRPNMGDALMQLAGKDIYTYAYTPFSTNHRVPENRHRLVSFAMGNSVAKKTTRQDLLKRLARGETFILATEVTEGFSNFNNQAFQRITGKIPLDYALPIGGHAVTVVGYKLNPNRPDDGHFIIRNSWGTKWGDNGYGYLPFSWCQYYRCGAWELKYITMRFNRKQT